MSGVHSVEDATHWSAGEAANGAPSDSIAADIPAVFTLTISSVGFAISFAVLIVGCVLPPSWTSTPGQEALAGRCRESHQDRATFVRRVIYSLT